MKNKPKLIIFDWDGTLANTRNAVVESMNYILSLYNLPEWEIIKKEKRDIKKSLKENFINFFGEKDEKEAYNRYLEYYKLSSFKKVEKNDHTIDFLNILQDEKIKMAIISNKDKSLLDVEVNNCFPELKFCNVIGNSYTENNKPSPDPVFKLMKNFDFELNDENVWLIGDTKQDTDCAIHSNCKPILIGKGKFMDDGYLKQNKTIIVFDSFKELINWFKD